MQTKELAAPVTATSSRPENTLYVVLLAVSFSHLLNDTIQSLIPAIYPTVKETFHLTFAQIGLIKLTFQLTAALLQPIVGSYTDRRPKPYSLAAGMGFTLFGLVLLSVAWNFTLLLVAVSLVGLGSAVFHPEASRLAHLASGGRHGLAQSLFLVGGNAGSSLGPLLAAVIIAQGGQSRVLCFPWQHSRPFSSCGAWGNGTSSTLWKGSAPVGAKALTVLPHCRRGGCSFPWRS